MKEFETFEIEQALRSERGIEPSKFETPIQLNHSKLQRVAEGIASLNAEWHRLQEEQRQIIEGTYEANRIEA